MSARLYPKRKVRLFIAEWRDKAGLSQRRLAGRLGVTDVTISRWETGERVPTINALAAIAEALGRTLEDMYRHPDTPSADELLRDQPPIVVDQAMKLIRAIRQ